MSDILTKVKRKLSNIEWDSADKLIIYSVLMGFLLGGLILGFMGYNFWNIYGTMLYGVFGKTSYLLQVIIRATPVILTGVAFLFALKTGLFNIGVEGQFMMGAIMANIAGALISLPWYLHIPFTILAGVLGGAIYASVMGLLKALYNVHEVISAIMLNWVAFYLTNYFVSIPLLKRENSEYAISIASSASISILKDWKVSAEGIAWRQANPFWNDLLKNHLNYGIFFAIVVAFLVAFILKKTTLGYRLKAVGNNARASHYLGINVPYNMALALAISGGIAGLAGALQVMGVDFAIYKLLVQRGYGFDGIAVAFLALGSPIGAIFSGLFYAALQVGGDRLQIIYGIPVHGINIMIAIIVFFVGMPYFFKVVLREIKKYQMKKGSYHAK